MSDNNLTPILYNIDSRGRQRHWRVEYNDEAYRTHYGQIGGRTTVSKWYAVEPTNVGRANERDRPAQVRFEVQALEQKKLDAGFSRDSNVAAADAPIKPMLADKWSTRKHRTEFPVWSQRKLDGLRMIASERGAFTRNGKSWVTVPHILQALAPWFRQHPGLVLDGEIYNHEFHDDFNAITSLAKKTKPTAQDLELAASKLQYHVYDVMGTGSSFTERTQFLHESLGSLQGECVVLVDTTQADNEQELNDLYERYLEQGYEGQMVRTNGFYENKRSKNLLKRKEINDAEYLIVGVGEGRGNKAGMAGYLVCETETGEQFHSNIKGSHSYLTELWHTRDTLPGQYATIQYLNLTPGKGIPRFPYTVAFRPAPGVDV